MWMTEEIADTRRLLGASREDSALACRLIAEAKRKLYQTRFADGEGGADRPGSAGGAALDGPDGEAISLSGPYEVRDWCKALRCSKDELKRAVETVGPSAARVREFLAAR